MIPKFRAFLKDTKKIADVDEMKTRNKYITVTAELIGEDGSRVFEKGTMYLLKMRIVDGDIIISSENKKSLWCTYGSLEEFLENWKLN